MYTHSLFSYQFDYFLNMDAMKETKALLWKFLYIDHPEIFQAFVLLTKQKEYLQDFLYKTIKSDAHKQSSYSILDVGGADGTLSLKLCCRLLKENVIKKSQLNLYLVDPSPIMLKLAQKKLQSLNPANIHLLHGSFGTDGIPDQLKNKRFDTILASYVFFWIESHDKAISQMYSLLDNQGRIIVIDYSSKARLRRDLLRMATGLDMETIEDIRDLLRNKFSNRVSSIHHFQNKIEFPGNFLERLETESELFGDEPYCLRLLEFLLRTSWAELTNEKKHSIIRKLKQEKRDDDFLCGILQAY